MTNGSITANYVLISSQDPNLHEWFEFGFTSVEDDNENPSPDEYDLIWRSAEEMPILIDETRIMYFHLRKKDNSVNLTQNTVMETDKGIIINRDIVVESINEQSNSESETECGGLKFPMANHNIFERVKCWAKDWAEFESELDIVTNRNNPLMS